RKHHHRAPALRPARQGGRGGRAGDAARGAGDGLRRARGVPPGRAVSSDRDAQRLGGRLKETSATEQYADRPLPAHALSSGWRVALIIASFSISLPAFLNGAQTGLALGFGDAVLAALLAGAVLCLGACLTSLISVRTRLTTYLLVQRSFGRHGAALVNVVVALVHYGWFGVNVSFFGIAMVAAIRQLYGVEVPFGACVAIGSVLMTVSTIYGF